MNVLTTDARVLHELEYGGLLETALMCGLSIAVSEFIYDREFADHNGSYLRSLGLGVLSMTPDQVVSARQLNAMKRMLTFMECTAVVCAARPGHSLVTGSIDLIAAANEQSLAVLSLLGLLDAMLQAGCSKSAIYEGLKQISESPRCKHAKSDIAKRLNAWGFKD